MHGSSTRGTCSTSGLVYSSPDSLSLKNKELFQIAPVEGPRMGGVWLLDWCICGPTLRALKMRSRSGMNFFLSSFSKKYWCFYLHWSRDSVSPVCKIFSILLLISFNNMVLIAVHHVSKTNCYHNILRR